ncbi:sodium ABC transporter permease, partial [Leucobacter sp. OLES1]
FASKLGGDTKVAVVGTAGAVLEQAPGFDLQEVADQSAAEKLVRSGDVEAAVVPGGSGAGGVTVLAKDSAPASVVQLLSVQPEVKLLDPLDKNPMLAYFIAIGFGIVFMMSAVTFGTTIAQSVVEEKQTRIVEILLATVPARVLLAGKIIGNSILALAQVVAIIALASLGMLATGQDLLFGDLGTALIWFGVLFAFGFVLLATLYAATAALVSRQEDIGSVTSPVMMLVMIPYVLVIVFYTNPEVLAVMSYVPFSAPVGMPMRLYLGLAEWWEPLVAIVILIASIALVIGVGARIYENSILRTGSRVKLSEALKG